MPRVKKIIQARDGGPIPVAYSEVEVGGETVLAPVVVLEAGAQVQLSGSSVDLRGLHTNRPAATAVEPGTTYWSVDEPSAPGTVFVSDGTNWTELIDLTK